MMKSTLRNTIKSHSVKLCITLWLSFFLISLVSCEDMFQDKIPFPGNDPSSLNDLLRTAEKIVKLQTPSQFYITPNYSSSEIRLTWSSVNGAAYYKVERAVAELIPGSNPPKWEEPDDGDYENLGQSVYGTLYIDEVLKNPSSPSSLDSPEYLNKYYYRVSAFNTVKRYEESDPTVPQWAMLFRAPGNLKATGGVSVEYVELRWEHTTGATSYEIWRSDFYNGASATMLDTVLGNQNWYQNKVSSSEQGKDFYYMVTAKNSFGNQTLRTRPAYGYAKTNGAPDTPKNVKLQDNSGRGNSKTEIKIKWDAVDEAEVYYAVYRYSSVDSSLTMITPKTDKTELSDTVGLKPGIYYYYRVQAIVDDISAGKSLKSEFSDPSKTESFILSPPDGVVAEKNSNGAVIIKWLPALGSENERLNYTYKVYSDDNVNGSFSTPAASNVSPSTDGQYISTNVPAGNTFFRVATVNGTVESEKSIVVSPSPDKAVIIGASQKEYFLGAAANSSNVYPVKITWKKPDGDNPAFYHIQRSTRSGSGFSKVNETALGANGPWEPNVYYRESDGTYVYMDKNETARVGRKYYYRVLSLNQLEQGNFPSDEKIGWGALTYTQYMTEYNKTMNAALKKLTYMHKPGSTEKLGTETKNGLIGGTIYYDANIKGTGARIIIRLTNYQEFYIENDPANGVYFILNGESNTSASMDSSGTMDGTVTCTGMYPGEVVYNEIRIKGGTAGGGTYGVKPEGFPSKGVPYNDKDVNW